MEEEAMDIWKQYVGEAKYHGSKYLHCKTHIFP